MGNNYVWDEEGYTNRSFKDAVDLQRQQEDARVAAEDRAAFDEIMGVGDQGAMQRARMRRMQGIGNAAAMVSAFENGGMMSNDLRDTLTATHGQPIMGGLFMPDGKFAYLGPSRTEEGKMGIVGKSNVLTSLKILQDAHVGDRGLPVRNYLWKIASQKYTPTQLESVGIQNPNGVYSTGSTSGKGVSRLFGITAQPKPKYGISAFGADGKGGFTKYQSSAETGYNVVEEPYGTRDPEYRGRWKWQTSDADGKVWVNDKTGEEVRTKPGENLRDALARIAKTLQGDRIAIEQLRQNGMNDRAKMRYDGVKQSLEMRTKELEERIQKRLSEAKSDEEKRKILEEAKAEEMRINREEIEVKWAKLGIDSSSGEVRKKASEKVSGKLDGDISETVGDKGTIKPSDNSGNETSKQEPPNGEYTKVKDGVSYHWGKSKNGEWGYFPDKKK